MSVTYVIDLGGASAEDGGAALARELEPLFDGVVLVNHARAADGPLFGEIRTGAPVSRAVGWIVLTRDGPDAWVTVTCSAVVDGAALVAAVGRALGTTRRAHVRRLARTRLPAP